MTPMTHSIDNENNVVMALHIILKQVEHVILQSIIWKFNKEPDYQSPDQGGGCTKDA